MTVQQKAHSKVNTKFCRPGLAPITEEKRKQFGTLNRSVYQTSLAPVAKDIQEDESEFLDQTEHLSEEGAFGVEEDHRGAQ
mmetsp:Transcript_42083/g.64516  ORF Transcript_42083/g.64516 Transcript_42083/m.64516 type:complete len:81 (+) Transcript_42083:979-1221(+)